MDMILRMTNKDAVRKAKARQEKGITEVLDALGRAAQGGKAEDPSQGTGGAETNPRAPWR